MEATIRDSSLFAGLDDEAIERFQGIARTRDVREGEYLFLLGDTADHIYVVVQGQIDICFPLTFKDSIRDISVESKAPGDVLGWSALVLPHRFTFSARAAEPAQVACFARTRFVNILDERPSVASLLSRRIAEVIAQRFLTVQALWVRELQRKVADSMESWTREHPRSSQ